MTKDQISIKIHKEVAKYLNREFSDQDDFQIDLDLASDDLSAIALSIERQFGVRIDRRRYRHVTNVDEYAELVQETLEAGGPERAR
ncbi:MAG TPA: hypothetical protein VFR92_07000 [Sphingomicrobium sp.]|jgi:acyl carrier protein|nr:hypothetical protein [Sphingomicrobium sp.]